MSTRNVGSTAQWSEPATRERLFQPCYLVDYATFGGYLLDTSGTVGRYLVEDADGFLRMNSSATGARTLLGPTTAGSDFTRIYS